MAKVSVFGLGYVGCVSAACLAKSGHQVVGVDVDAQRVGLVRDGRSPVDEPGLHELVAQATIGHLTATADVGLAVNETDIALICVGTPGHSNGEPDTTAIRDAAKQIGRALSGRARPFTVVLRSTCLPGTVEDVILPTLEATAGSGTSIAVGANPEFLREGTAIRDFYSPPMVLIGATTLETAELIAGLYRDVVAPVVITAIRNAEAVKYASNAYHALKVCFANEMAEVASRAGADPREVMRIFAMDRKLNISEAYLRPGFAFGGPCLAKDVEALTWTAKDQAINVPVVRAILESNSQQIQRCVEAVLETGRRRVGLIGLGFKPVARDLRGSPVAKFARALYREGCDVRIFEPLCHRGLSEDVPLDLVAHVCPDLASLLLHADMLVIGPGVGAEDAERVRSIAGDRAIFDLSEPWKSVEQFQPSSSFAR